MEKMPARTGWTWLKEGARLVRQQPGVLTTALFAGLLSSIVIGSIPYLGPVIVAILVPSFSIAIMQACAELDDGKRASLGVLLAGFRKPAVISLCKVGVVYLLVSLLLTGVASLVISDEVLRQAAAPANPTTATPLGASDLLSMMLVAMLNVTTIMTLSFSAPLAYWQQMGPGKATFYSFFAVLRSVKVFAVLLLSWIGMFALAALMTRLVFGSGDFGKVLLMWIGALFALLLQCSLYIGYRDIFGRPPALAAKAA